MRSNIEDLNKRVFVDALTSSKNKGAFSNAIEGMQKQLDADDPGLAFAIGVFDCDNLKVINDEYGHEKGDIYLKTASDAICSVFQHSPVFRIGGDEFVVVIVHAHTGLRTLVKSKVEKVNRALAVTSDGLPPISVSVGITYGSEASDAIELMKLADLAMYRLKRNGKQGYQFSDDK
jgi:diguanylate cyclase (GGDEF)-like protein